MNTELKTGILHERKLRVVICCGALWLLAGIFGCSQQPTRLAHQIAAADRIVATSRWDDVSVVVADEEAKRIVAAVTSAKRDKNHYSAVFGWHLQFYSGTNLLAAIRLQDQVFKTKEAQYNDGTGVLKKFCERDLAGAERRAAERAAEEILSR